MEKIKISELSIGDWVYYDDIVFGREIAKVHRLNKDDNDETIGITVHRSDGAFGVVGYILTSPTDNDIYPIPLTPKILEKNGISKTYESDEYAVYKGEGFNVTEYYTELWEFERRRTRLMIRNVHQLQHALRLAGVEKEIEL
jgi:hypothetical protein